MAGLGGATLHNALAHGRRLHSRRALEGRCTGGPPGIACLPLSTLIVKRSTELNTAGNRRDGRGRCLAKAGKSEVRLSVGV